MALSSVPQYDYRKLPSGEEIVSQKEYPIWVNPDLVVRFVGTTEQEESPWWKVVFDGGNRFYTSFDGVRSIGGGRIDDGGGIRPDPEIGTTHVQVNRYSYSKNQSSGEVSARIVSSTTYVNPAYVVSIEQADLAYWKVRMKTGEVYYTDLSSAQNLGVQVEAQPG